MAAGEQQVGKFGRIALEMGLVSWEQIQECLSLQMDYERSGREVPRLGTLLLTRGHLTSAQVKQILQKQNSEREEKAQSAVNNFLVSYAQGTVIFREGDKKNRDLFLLNAGKVELVKRGVSINERCGPGAFFGVSSFLLKTPRSATAVAKTDCKAFRIPAEKAADFFKSKPAMAVKLAMVLAEDLFILKNRFVETHLNAVEAAKSRKPEEHMQKPAIHALELPGGTHLASDGNGRMQIRTLSKESPIYLNRQEASEGDYITNGDKIQVGRHLLQFYSTHEEIIEHQKPEQSIDDLVATAIMEASPKKNLTRTIEISVPEGIPAETEALTKPEEILTSEPETIAENSVNSFSDNGQVDENDNAVMFSSQLSELEAEQASENDTDEDIDNEDSSECSETEGSKLPRGCLTGEQSELPEAQSSALSGSAQNAIIEEISLLKSQPFSHEIIEAVSNRISFWVYLEKLEEKRLKLEEQTAEPSERFKSEFARQRREIQRIPPLESLQVTREKLLEKLNPSPPEPDEDGNIPPIPEPLDKEMQLAYKVAIEQKDILIARDNSTGKTLHTCLTQALAEPLYRIFSKYNIDRGDIFGWAVYAQALQEYSDAQTARIKQVRADIEEVNNTKSGGFLGLGRKSKEEKEARLSALQEDDKKYKLIVTSVNRELKSIEKEMVDEFWRVYEQATQALVAGVDDLDCPYIRGFVRWGLLGHSPMWCDSEKCRNIISDCLSAPADPVFRMDQDYVYYADEIIQLIAQGKLPPTSNEDLELNHRNSPLWRADRAWRKIINCTMQEGIYRHIMDDLARDAEEIRKDQTIAEEELEKVQSKANDKDKRRNISQLRHQIQNCKVKAGRLERLVEKLSEETIPRSIGDKAQAQNNLMETRLSFTPAQLAEHEIKCMRRNARLVAKLKEPFLPFTIRERYKPENDCVNTRQVVLDSLKDAEMRDPLVFKEPLVPSAKKIHRILLRLPPVVVIAPAGGIMGFMMSPRAGMESGKLVVPAYYERANMREDILWNVLSDFRFDTSKASAGVDVMNSDTLVAAYAQVRWDLRKRDKEVRQKSGIYMEENERTNWRRHYSIYMKSALDSGKLLFYKCPELYELIINKFVDLPEGCEILKR